MKTIRRIYFYAVAFISMEVVLWGMIGLARSIFSGSGSGGVSQLSEALALILVGVPVFGIHWWAAQRSAAKDEEERSSGVRALFFYFTLLALLIPLTQNGLAVLNRLVINLFDIPSSRAMVGGYQSLSDNLIAGVFNALVSLYFFNTLKKEWHEVSDKASLTLLRRIYRYIWVLYSLIMSIIGVNQILLYILSLFTDASDIYNNVRFANGLSLVLIGIPLWVWAWKTVQDSQKDPREKGSLLRLGILYFLSLAGVIAVLSATGFVIDEFLQFLLDKGTNFRDFIKEINEPLAVAIPLGVVWAYYGSWLNRDLTALPSAPQRAKLRRLYYYILALIGLVASFVGVSMLLSFIIDSSLATNISARSLRSRLAGSLATLFVGLPLWLKTWRPMQAQALALDEAGEQARRSVVRKIYLYLAIFAGVVGGMVAAVSLLSMILESLLGDAPNNLANSLLDSFQVLILFGGLLAYHWQSQKRDGLLRSETLNEKGEKLKVLLFDTESETLLPKLAFLMNAESDEISLIPQSLDDDIPEADAVILPTSLVLEAPEKLKTWLSTFNGSKLIVPSESEKWFWMDDLAEIKKSLHRLAEGEDIQQSRKTPGWMITVYILAGMMALQILFFLTIIIFDSF